MPASCPVLKPSSPSSPPAAALPYKREHLIWEPGFGRRFLLSLALCGILLLAAKHSQEAWLHGMAFQAWLTGWMMWFSHQLQWWSVLGLLSSSCCVLQLLLNAFSTFSQLVMGRIGLRHGQSLGWLRDLSKSQQQAHGVTVSFWRREDPTKVGKLV